MHSFKRSVAALIGSGYTKAGVFVLALLPCLLAIRQMAHLLLGRPHHLGVDPGEYLMLWQGEVAIWLLIVTLSLSPLRQITGMAQWLRHRRMLGLFVFFYALLHALGYATFMLQWQGDQLWSELQRRPYLWVGAAALIGLLLLALTSTQAMVRRLGRYWKRLHQGVYGLAILVLVHEWMQEKGGVADSVIHSLLLGSLLLYRLAKSNWPCVRWCRRGDRNKTAQAAQPYSISDRKSQ